MGVGMAGAAFAPRVPPRATSGPARAGASCTRLAVPGEDACLRGDVAYSARKGLSLSLVHGTIAPLARNEQGASLHKVTQDV